MPAFFLVRTPSTAGFPGILARQLAEPRPYDLSAIDLAHYRRLEQRWRDWTAVADACRRLAVGVLERTAEEAG